MSERLARINRLVLTTLGELVPGFVRDPRVAAAGLVAIQEVRTSPDLRHAKVYVSIQGDEDVRQRALQGLQNASSSLRRELARRVKLRSTPDLRFILDRSEDVAGRVDEILREVAAERRARAVSLEYIVEQIAAAERILVTTHPNPDGDAIGSVVATTLALQKLPKTVVAFDPDPVPATFRFLAGSEQIMDDLPPGEFDLTLVLDCSDGRMFGRQLPDRARLGCVAVIDHHRTVGNVGDVIYRDPTVAATGVLVYRLVRALGLDVDLPIAEALYCSLLSDTGSFRYGNTNPEAMRVAAELLELGINAWHVASHIYENRPRRQLDLLIMVLRTLQISEDGRAAALTVTESMLKQTQCTPDMVDGFINYARAVEGVEVGILLRPHPDGLRVSLRSRGHVDVSALASDFGGGGHHNAAGFTVQRSAAEVVSALFAEVGRMCRARGSSDTNELA